MIQHAAAVASALVLLTSGAGGPRDARLGAWEVASGPGWQLASTMNDAGASLGVWCDIDTEKCLAIVLTTNSCDDGSTVPMMLNSPVGSSAVTTVCKLLPAGDGEPAIVSVVNEFAAMRSAMESGGTVGIAIPMANGSFHVLRFSTAGATAAIRKAMTVPPGRPGRKLEPQDGPPSSYM